MSVKAPPRTPAAPAKAEDIDPRIRARRIQVRRTEGRRRLHRLTALAVACAVVVSGWWLTLTPLFDVDHIRVHGADHTESAAVLEVVDIHRGDALLTAAVERAARALAQLPWIATAQVRRSWPGTVSITVVEREPVAAIATTRGAWVLVDRGGRQLATQKEPAIDLVRVAGRAITPDLGAIAGERYQGSLDLASVIPPSMRGSIGAVWPQRDGSLEATVALPGTGSTGTRRTAVVRFGPADQLEAKLVALAAVLERADLDRIRVIDLRVPAAPALTRA